MFLPVEVNFPQGKAYSYSSSEHNENEIFVAMATAALHSGLNRLGPKKMTHQRQSEDKMFSSIARSQNLGAGKNLASCNLTLWSSEPVMETSTISGLERHTWFQSRLRISVRLFLQPYHMRHDCAQPAKRLSHSFVCPPSQASLSTSGCKTGGANPVS